jgi:hypothetical protein
MSVNPYEPPITATLAEPVEPKPIWDEIEVEYELTIEDLVAWNMHVLRHSPSQRRMRRRVSLVVFITLLLAIVSLLTVRVFTSPDPFTPGEVVVYGSAIFAVCIVFALRGLREGKKPAVAWNAERMVRSMLTEGDTSSTIGPRRLRVTKDHLYEADDLHETKWKLKAVQRIVMVPQYAFIYVAPVRAYILPVRAFASPDHWQTFVANLEGHTGKRAERFES